MNWTTGNNSPNIYIYMSIKRNYNGMADLWLCLWTKFETMWNDDSLQWWPPTSTTNGFCLKMWWSLVVPLNGRSWVYRIPHFRINSCEWDYSSTQDLMEPAIHRFWKIPCEFALTNIRVLGIYSIISIHILYRQMMFPSYRNHLHIISLETAEKKLACWRGIRHWCPTCPVV